MPRFHNSLPEAERWATVHVAANSFEADLVRGLLDEEGIATISEADVGGMIFGKAGSIRILVPREEEVGARDLLRAYHGPPLRVINFADYRPEPQLAGARRFLLRLYDAAAVPVLVLVVISLVFVVLRWA